MQYLHSLPLTQAPTGLLLDASCIYVAMGDSILVLRLSDGEPLRSIGGPDVIGHPRGLATDGRSLFVADGSNARVTRLPLDGVGEAYWSEESGIQPRRSNWLGLGLGLGLGVGVGVGLGVGIGVGVGLGAP